MSFLQIGADGSVNVSHSPLVHMSLPDAVDLLISPHSETHYFLWLFQCRCPTATGRGQLRIIKEGKAKKLVQDVAQ